MKRRGRKSKQKNSQKMKEDRKRSRCEEDEGIGERKQGNCFSYIIVKEIFLGVSNISLDITRHLMTSPCSVSV